MLKMPQRQRILYPVLAPCLFAMLAWSVVTQSIWFVRHFPSTATVFKSVGLPINVYNAKFVNVIARAILVDGDYQIVVEGEIHNLIAKTNVVPNIQLSLVGERGAVAYSWIARLPDNRLKSRDKLAFRTSLAGPPPGEYRVAVNFPL